MRNNFIGGEWIVGTDARPNLNPSDLSDAIDQYAAGGERTVDLAVQAAAAASQAWSVSTPQQRFDALDFAGEALRALINKLGLQ